MEDALPIIKVEVISEDCDNCLFSDAGGVVFSSGALDCKVETDSNGWSSFTVSNGALSATEAKVFKAESWELPLPMSIKCDSEGTTLNANTRTEDFLEEIGDVPLKSEADPFCTEQTYSSAGIKAELQQDQDGSALAPVLSSEMNHPPPDLVSRYQLRRLSVLLVDCCTRLGQEGTNGKKNKDGVKAETDLCGGPETESISSAESINGINFVPKSTAVPEIVTHPLTKRHCRSLCGERVDARRSLTAHQLIHRGKKSYVCQHCDKSFSDATKLKLHNCIHTGERPYACQNCDKSFSDAGDLKRHQRIHTGERPYVCQDCGKSFSHVWNLKLHNRIHTGERPYVCQNCSKSFSHVWNLKLHNRIHTGERPYVCQNCSKSFSQRGDLKRHQRTHTGERPYICRHCNKCFTEPGHLKRHQRTHMGEKLNVCHQCGKSFSRAEYLKLHQHIHTGERPYACQICSKRFSQGGNLKRHQLIHTGERPLGLLSDFGDGVDANAFN